MHRAVPVALVATLALGAGCAMGTNDQGFDFAHPPDHGARDMPSARDFSSAGDATAAQDGTVAVDGTGAIDAAGADQSAIPDAAVADDLTMGPPDATAAVDASANADAVASPDLAPVADLASASDAVTLADATVLPDATAIPDLVALPDAARPPDATVLPDATVPPDMVPALPDVALVVARIGDGSSALTSAATAVFLDQFLLDGTAVTGNGWPVALPTATGGANQPLTVAGTATSEAEVTRATDGHTLALAGYDATPGTTGVSTSSASTIHRVVARIGATGTVDTTTQIGDGFSGSNVRSAATVDGSAFWLSGSSNGSSGGVRYVTFGGTTSTQILTTPSNTRVAGIFGGQLYVDSGSANYTAVLGIGTGLPTTSGQTATALPGMATTGASPYAYVLLDRSSSVAGLDTLYVSDDTATVGGVQKWTFDGSSWSLVATFNNGITTGTRGLTAYATASAVYVVATTTETNQNRVVFFVDDGTTTNPAARTVATAAANTVYRGVALAPQ